MVSPTTIIHEACNTAVAYALAGKPRAKRMFSSPPTALQDIVIGEMTTALLFTPARDAPSDALCDEVRSIQLAVRYGLGVTGDLEELMRGVARSAANRVIATVPHELPKEPRRGRRA